MNLFLERKEVFMSKGLKVNLGKTKVMVSGDITVTHGVLPDFIDCCLFLSMVCVVWAHDFYSQ